MHNGGGRRHAAERASAARQHTGSNISLALKLQPGTHARTDPVISSDGEAATIPVYGWECIAHFSQTADSFIRGGGVGGEKMKEGDSEITGGWSPEQEHKEMER